MPGHVKLGAKGEPDPDPKPYLLVDIETKRADQNLEYDPKKSYWVPDGKGGFMKSMLESDDGTKAVVMCGHEVSVTIIFLNREQYSFKNFCPSYQTHPFAISNF